MTNIWLEFPNPKNVDLENLEEKIVMLCLFWCYVHSFLTGLIILNDWTMKSEFPNQDVLFRLLGLVTPF